MKGDSSDFDARVRSLLKEKSGREVWSANETFIFRFARENQSETLMPEWREYTDIRNLWLIGFFANGDTVCANPAGKITVGFYDEDSNYAWWESTMTLEELLNRIESHDEDIQEDVFSMGPKSHGS